jgi:predicted transcriptional regulator
VTGKGRPRIGTAVLIRIPDDLLRLIDRDAHQDERNRAAQIRYIITHYYEPKDPS